MTSGECPPAPSHAGVGPAFVQHLLTVTLLPFSHSGRLGDQRDHLSVTGLCSSLPYLTYDGPKAQERVCWETAQAAKRCFSVRR